ncbi:hypothetical protein [Candidatus Poriferisodalis sp.]|uniref:hypothetical protein n=1 Tax=Candidatus Poriferisodalis sp. TaxID=3101277 RepID=UPI003B0123F3
MSTATETATKARINAIRDDDESLRQLSDEELDQVAGGQWTFSLCNMTIYIHSHQASSFREAFESAEEIHDAWCMECRMWES